MPTPIQPSPPEARPEPLIDDLPCGLLSTDADGVVLWANRRFGEWAGREAGSLAGAALQDLLSERSRSQWRAHWRPKLDRGEDLSECDFELRLPSGNEARYSMSCAPRGRGGSVAWDFTLLPATGREAQERELSETQAELRLLVHEATRVEEDAKDRALFAEQMVGIVSHDLRNPLSAIHMGALALSKGDLSSNQMRVLGRLSRSAERATRLIADLLDFTAARIGEGLSVAPRPVDLREVVADAVEELALAFPDRSLEHRHDGPGQCSADPDRISQLVGNLVANAMAYGDPERAVVVTTSCDHRGRCRLAVRNWGRPIPPDAIEGLFRPMVRGDVKGGGRSVGLGLYIVCEIAKAHGGGVIATSTEEDGTTFEVVFPPGAARRPIAGDVPRAQ